MSLAATWIFSYAHIILLWILFPPSSIAWTIADDCSGDTTSKVKEATISALNTAIYAKLRAQDSRSRVGTLLADLIGAPAEDDAGTLELVSTWMQNAVDAASVLSTLPSTSTVGTGLVVHCSDAHLTPINPSKGTFTDTLRHEQITVVQTTGGSKVTACGGTLAGFAYSYSGGQVIVLCSDSPNAAALGPAKLAGDVTWEGFRMAGDMRKTAQINVKGMDVLQGALSVKILHELMHVGGFYIQSKSSVFNSNNQNQFPSVLPDGGVTEIYTYPLISGKQLGSSDPLNPPTVNNRQHNADSFALLAAGWYLPSYTWKNGQLRVMRSDNPAKPPDTYPNQPTPPDPVPDPTVPNTGPPSRRRFASIRPRLSTFTTISTTIRTPLY